MAGDRSKPLSEIWAARYDDRDAEDLACQRWERGLTLRDRAMAQPVSTMSLAERGSAEAEAGVAPKDSPKA